MSSKTHLEGHLYALKSYRLLVLKILEPEGSKK